MMKLISNNKGFTLIEVLITLAVFATGFISFLIMTTNSIRGNADAFRVTRAGALASDSIERVLHMPYNSHDNGQDDDDDGVADNIEEKFNDENGDAEAGLDYVGEIGDGTDDPDYQVLTADGNYIIFWNVAEEYPGPNMKTIRMIVRNRLLDQSQGRDIVYTNIRIRNK